ncbi:hypothetical protein LR48_Vigan04g004000 [Vigna angularis]|uniref:Nitrate regulatory gene2 protein n=1 Tax=Phaseolus angularis TaxID=3914 RepID=A0A0L9UBA2_PHAAN|nr:protein ALTERED PHOSPHATE STARVATION RESPONSE 1 [Vigna angularis]XP_017422905.1 protein ALTERED PHOSPHATE STARVATION RESPONSE 1 [Vigna angularis]XP_017422906.1 protein ALTERED PHOSPHATE STARVATION RESPONSE 1 [Vigna angularis]KAG2398562.1 Nitrate regulatory gene2 protein [Vigna angularis]KOM39842.1 hypothetical protein LR48_Vigan04g004000 [Vigna angularis]
MGCSHSRLDDEEAVQLCRDRKKFIKQAVEHRTRLATGHIAYIESLKRVSAALRDYIEGDEPREFSLDNAITPPFTPVKKKSGPGFIPISAKPFAATGAIEFGIGPNSTLKVNYLRPGGNPAISVEERPQSPERVRVETYYPPMQQYGFDGFFNMQSSPVNPSIFAYSPNNRPTIPPPSPQASQWDFFWNPFSSLDSYGYPAKSIDHAAMDDEYRGLRQVREEEGIPDLEEDETEHEDGVGKRNVAEERTRPNMNSSKEEVIVEDVEDDDDDDDDDDDEEEEEEEENEEEEEEEETDIEDATEHVAKDSQAHGSASFEVSKAQAAGHIESSHREMTIGKKDAVEETPGFTVYVNRRPTSMAEVINDIETQFTIVYNAAKDVAALLEAKKSQYLLTSNELSGSKLLNPVALIRSASRSSSSRYLVNSSSTGKEGCDGSKDLSEEHCMLSGSHHSTLDRLNTWEKKLYEEVRSGERIRIAYEKKCKQLRNFDAKGEDPSCVDKARAAIRDLDTQITVSIHSVEAISRRIETLRDEELYPQLLELVQGLERMWKVMAECHQKQKRTLDEAKILLAGTYSKLHARKQSSMLMTDPNRLARSASNLEFELRNWRNAFESWITSQRSYIHALTGWLLRCMRSEPDASKLPCSPRRSSGTHPLFGLCVQWSRRLDAINEKAVLDGLDFFAAGMGSLYAHQLREDSRRNSFGPKQSNGNMELVEAGEVEEVMAPEKLAEVAIKVLCAGMSVAISSLAEFALDSAEGYNEVVKQWDNVKCQNTASSNTRT